MLTGNLFGKLYLLGKSTLFLRMSVLIMLKMIIRCKTSHLLKVKKLLKLLTVFTLHLSSITLNKQILKGQTPKAVKAVKLCLVRQAKTLVLLFNLHSPRSYPKERRIPSSYISRVTRRYLKCLPLRPFFCRHIMQVN